MPLRIHPVDFRGTPAPSALRSLDPVHAVPALHVYGNRPDLFARDLERHFEGDPAGLWAHLMKQDEATQAAALNHGEHLRACLGLDDGLPRGRSAAGALPDAEMSRALARAAILWREPRQQERALEKLGELLTAQRCDGSAANPAHRAAAADALLELLGRMSSLRGDGLKEKLLRLAAAHRPALDERQQDALHQRLTRLSRADERKFRAFIETNLPPSKSARKRRARPPGGATRERLLRTLAGMPRPASRRKLPPAAAEPAIATTPPLSVGAPPADVGARIESVIHAPSGRAGQPRAASDLLYLHPDHDAHLQSMHEADAATPPPRPRRRERAPAPGQPAMRARPPRHARRPLHEPLDEPAWEDDAHLPGISLADLMRLRRNGRRMG